MSKKTGRGSLKLDYGQAAFRNFLMSNLRMTPAGIENFELALRMGGAEIMGDSGAAVSILMALVQSGEAGKVLAAHFLITSDPHPVPGYIRDGYGAQILSVVGMFSKQLRETILRNREGVPSRGLANMFSIAGLSAAYLKTSVAPMRRTHMRTFVPGDPNV